MSDKPIIIKCNIILTPDDLKIERIKIMKQLEDGVVVLPPGFEVAAVDVKMLEKIKLEIDKQSTMHQDGDFYIKNYDVKKIIDKCITEIEVIEQL